MPKHQTTDMPTFDIRAMTEKAFDAVLPALRQFAKAMEDIDTLRRLLHLEAVQTLQERVPPHSNGNGHGAPARAASRKPFSKRANRQALRAAALDIIQAHPGGIGTVALRQRIVATTSIIDPGALDSSGDNAIRQALKPVVKAGGIRTTFKNGYQGGYTYYPSVVSPAPDEEPEAAAVEPKRATTLAIRQFILDTLIEDKKPMNTRDLKQAAVDAGFVDSGGDVMSNIIGREARNMAERGTIKLIGPPGKARSGRHGHSPVYVINRPNLKISKS